MPNITGNIMSISPCHFSHGCWLPFQCPLVKHSILGFTPFNRSCFCLTGVYPVQPFLFLFNWGQKCGFKFTPLSHSTGGPKCPIFGAFSITFQVVSLVRPQSFPFRPQSFPKVFQSFHSIVHFNFVSLRLFQPTCHLALRQGRRH